MGQKPLSRDGQGPHNPGQTGRRVGTPATGRSPLAVLRGPGARPWALFGYFLSRQKVTPRRVGETPLSHQPQPIPRKETQRWDAQKATAHKKAVRFQSDAPPTPKESKQSAQSPLSQSESQPAGPQQRSPCSFHPHHPQPKASRWILHRRTSQASGWQ